MLLHFSVSTSRTALISIILLTTSSLSSLLLRVCQTQAEFHIGISKLPQCRTTPQPSRPRRSPRAQPNCPVRLSPHLCSCDARSLTDTFASIPRQEGHIPGCRHSHVFQQRRLPDHSGYRTASRISHLPPDHTDMYTGDVRPAPVRRITYPSQARAQTAS